MYYVYKLIDPRSQLPFYVGKGKNNRCYDHYNGKASGENKRKDKLIESLIDQGYEPQIEFVAENLTEKDAYRLEEEMIIQYGRKGLDQNGILMNFCISNQPPNHTGRKRSAETIKKMKERKWSEEDKERISQRMSGQGNPMFGKEGPMKDKKFSDDHKEKISVALTGKKQSKETVEKRKQTKQDRGITISQKTIDAAAKKRRGMKLPEEWIEKRTNTRHKNGTYKRSPESILKGMKTSLLKNGYNLDNLSDDEIRSIYGKFMSEKRKSKTNYR